MQTFNRYNAHVHGKTHLSFSNSRNCLATLGQDDLILFWDLQDIEHKKQLELQNQLSEQYTCLSYSGKYEIVAVGTRSGKVFLIHVNNPSNEQIVYRGEGSIGGVQFSESGKFLAITSEGSHGVIYSRENKRFYKCKKGHDGLITNSFLTKDEQYFLTMGTDGYVNIFSFGVQGMVSGELQIQFISRYRISSGKLKDRRIKISERSGQKTHLSVGGSTTLQELFIEDKQTDYRLKVSIFEGTEIIETCWVNLNCIVLGTQEGITVWNYEKGNRIVTLRQEYSDIISNKITFFTTDMNGCLLQYKDRQVLKGIGEDEEKKIVEDEMQIQDEKQMSEKGNRVRRNMPEISKAASIITLYPQTALESRYEGYLENRFLFYNQVGCIIERTNSVDLLMQLEYHDKSKIRRIKFESTNKYICYFALTKQCFAYSSLTHFYVQYQGFNRVRKQHSQVPCKEYYLQKWDYKWNSIQGIVIGNKWIAVANDEEVKFFDFLGNQIHTICVDRKFMAIAAYEDIFIIVFHSGIPLFNSQLFQMKVYTVNERHCKFIKKTNVPIKTEELINWIGFSHQGMLFTQDTAENIRFYCWNTDQWISIYEGNKTKNKIYIQHIENYELYGFNIEQKQGQPSGPTVLPRSLPRKIYLQFSQPQFDFLQEKENQILKSIAMKKYIYEHENFRYERWYHLKYARRKDNVHYDKTINILSEQELNLMLSQRDIRIVDYVKKVWVRLQKSEREKQIKYKLLYLCSNYVSSMQTIRKLKSILKIDEKLSHLNEYSYELDNNFSEDKEEKCISRIQRICEMLQMIN